VKSPYPADVEAHHLELGQGDLLYEFLVHPDASESLSDGMRSYLNRISAVR